jgi:phosphatidylserine/phosphatidylglycerophosphate/cardiolipin synthase-like enzyme
MSIYFNGANCDIYIGTGAGKMLLNDIRNARKSVKIVSPYLTASLIAELIEMRNRNIDIQLITMDNIEENFYEDTPKNIYKLIIQHRSLDKEAENLRNKWISISKTLLYTIIAIVAIELLLIYFIRDLKLVLGIAPIAVLLGIYKLYKTKARAKRIYNYWYSQLFPFKVYISSKALRESRSTFIHSKIYLIDNTIAYLGSLNFTKGGTEHSHETRVRTVSPGAIYEINKEIEHLFSRLDLWQRDIQLWGKLLYKEPIN